MSLFIIFYVVVCILFGIFTSLVARENKASIIQCVLFGLGSFIFWPIVLLSLTIVMIIRAFNHTNIETEIDNDEQ